MGKLEFLQLGDTPGNNLFGLGSTFAPLTRPTEKQVTANLNNAFFGQDYD